MTDRITLDVNISRMHGMSVSLNGMELHAIDGRLRSRVVRQRDEEGVLVGTRVLASVRC